MILGQKRAITAELKGCWIILNAEMTSKVKIDFKCNSIADRMPDITVTKKKNLAKSQSCL